MKETRYLQIVKRKKKKAGGDKIFLRLIVQ